MREYRAQDRPRVSTVARTVVCVQLYSRLKSQYSTVPVCVVYCSDKAFHFYNNFLLILSSHHSSFITATVLLWKVPKHGEQPTGQGSTVRQSGTSHRGGFYCNFNSEFLFSKRKTQGPKGQDYGSWYEFRILYGGFARHL